MYNRWFAAKIRNTRIGGYIKLSIITFTFADNSEAGWMSDLANSPCCLNAMEIRSTFQTIHEKKANVWVAAAFVSNSQESDEVTLIYFRKKIPKCLSIFTKHVRGSFRNVTHVWILQGKLYSSRIDLLWFVKLTVQV